jgi:hypothetical protein
MRTLLLGLLLVLTALPPAAAASDDAPSAPPRVSPDESVLSEYNPEARPNPKPPPYTLLRFNEDYTYLANPRNRTDPFDAVKYIPLDRDDPKTYLSFGGELRERFEYVSNPRFGVPPNLSHDEYLLQRLVLHGDLHWTEHFRLFVQGISGLQLGSRAEDLPPPNHDVADLEQAFADVRMDDHTASEPSYVVVRGGRFQMTYGSGRLVATRQAPNIPFKFDGGQLIATRYGAKLYAFVTKPARERETQFDDEAVGQLFWGVYATTPWLTPGSALRADLYYLGFRNDEAQFASGTGAEKRHTLGVRVFGGAAGFDWDVEPVLQFGTFGRRDILAWTLASSQGYTMDALPWSPRLGLQANVASGDTHAGGSGDFGTFNPLFFKAGYFNDASLIRPSNIMDVHPTLQVHPGESVMVTIGSDVLWRYTTKDGIYGPGGNLELPAGGGSRYVATTADVSAQWQLNRHVTWITSYNHFFTGSYVDDAKGGDVDFFGSWISFIW